MKPILLIYPPFEGKNVLTSRFPFPLGLLYIAAYLESKGLKSEVWDFSYPPTKRKTVRPKALKKSGVISWSRYGWNDLAIRSWLNENLYRFHNVIGIGSLMSTNYTGMYRISRLLRNLDPNITIIAGGPHATADPEHVFKNSEVDYICIGEGEDAFHKFLKDEYHPAIIGGFLSWQDTEYQKRAFIKEMDSLPFPKRSLLKDDRKMKDIYITFSRGCPHNCSFCGSYKIQGRTWRHKSIERAVDELKFYIKEWGVKKFIIEDDNATPGKVGIKWMKNLCTLIITTLPKIRLSISHGIPVYATADKELCDLMWKAGFRKMVFPLESTNPETLKHMKKEDTPKNYKIAIKNWSYEKAQPTEIIIGYPFVDTIETMLQTIVDIAEQGALAWCSHFRLNKDTPLFQQCLDAGYVDKNYDTLSASTFYIETERFKIEDLREIMQIARGANYGTERHGINVFACRLNLQDPNFTLKSDILKSGAKVAIGKFAFRRSQNFFAAILMMRKYRIHGKPVISYGNDNDLFYSRTAPSRVWMTLAKILKIENDPIKEFLK